MKMRELHEKLIAAARKMPADDRVPYAFEKRIMARILAGLRPDPWVAWGGALWRAALPCLAVMALCSIYVLSNAGLESPDDLSRDVPREFSRDFELAVFATASADDVDADAW